MEDEQLRQIAQLLVNNVIEKAVDKIKSEKKEIDEGFDQGVHDIVGLAIGRSITAIREGQSSPTDDKMKGFTRQLDKEVDSIVGLTIGRSIEAIREGHSSPTDNKMEGMLGLNKTLVNATPEVTIGATGSKPVEERDTQIKSCVKGKGKDNQLQIVTSDPVKDDKLAGLETEQATEHQMSKTSSTKNVLKRLIDRILKRDKKEAKGINAATAGGSTSTSVGGKKSSSKANNKRDWIRRNLLCCFVRQTATVEPLFE
ncbi:uncharacterized protein LOC110450510 [Mizuhopecten yessoensis]|uniref:Uncharacterized protein n=1 Tax=Mizuhopecten yessoensis TaxID=6573 RepID=A0A210QNW0_MIZYE|nr:uncharacterized protein LOC110450510 [Mizuhopecten yessoensis]OWF50411.1 hypothetical protein KP79_PYT09436 [Mizuhopecten yessoensis]